jgi:hypothetical protein
MHWIASEVFTFENFERSGSEVYPQMRTSVFGVRHRPS